MDLIIRLIFAYVVTVGAGLSLESPKRIVFRTGIIGVASYAIYLYFIFALGIGEVFSTFVACFIASIISQVFARKYKSAVILFYVPTFFLYVPGSTIYQMAFNLIENNTDLAGQYLVSTLKIAGAIALGIFVADSVIAIYLGFKRRGIDRIKSSVKKGPVKFKIHKKSADD